MGNLKTNMIIVATLTTVLLGITGPTASYEAESKIAQVAYITQERSP